MLIDPTFDFSSDSGGRDPDSHSKTLKEYHKFLWSQDLPVGGKFELKECDPKRYLVFHGRAGDHFLSSDAITNSFRDRKGKISLVINQVNEIDSDLVESFYKLNSTIGGYLVFPGNRIEDKATINAERGLNYYISDRFDLSLECIKRHYLSVENPLQNVLNRYAAFFALFKDFKSYVDFFYLNDLVTQDYSAVKYFMPSENIFKESPLPQDIDSYLMYRENSMKFTQSRNIRLASLSS